MVMKFRHTSLVTWPMVIASFLAVVIRAADAVKDPDHSCSLSQATGSVETLALIQKGTAMHRDLSVADKDAPAGKPVMAWKEVAGAKDPVWGPYAGPSDGPTEAPVQVANDASTSAQMLTHAPTDAPEATTTTAVPLETSSAAPATTTTVFQFETAADAATKVPFNVPTIGAASSQVPTTTAPTEAEDEAQDDECSKEVPGSRSERICKVKERGTKRIEKRSKASEARKKKRKARR